MISRYAFSTTAKLASRRKISATSCTCASYVFLSARLPSAKLALKTPKGRAQPDERRRSRQLQTL